MYKAAVILFFLLDSEMCTRSPSILPIQRASCIVIAAWYIYCFMDSKGVRSVDRFSVLMFTELSYIINGL